jgi:hypothetical protein
MEICLLGLILSIIDKFSNRIDQTIGKKTIRLILTKVAGRQIIKHSKFD